MESVNLTVKLIPYTSAFRHVLSLSAELPGLAYAGSKMYALNPDNVTVCTYPQWKRGYCTGGAYIVVGQHPGSIASNYKTLIVYIGYPQSGTISVIKGFTDKVAVGAIFNVNPPDSGAIKCDGTIYPTNTYLYVDSGADCTAQNNKGFEFNTWTESPLTNRNSSTPIEQWVPSGPTAFIPVSSIV